MRLLTCLLISLIAACAAPGVDDSRELAAEYIAISGFDELVSGMKGQFEQQRQQNISGSRDPARERRYYELLVELADIEDLRRRTREFIKANTDEPFLQGMLDWYRTDLGSRMRDATVEASDAANADRVLAYVRGLQHNKPRRERIDLVNLIEETTDTAGILTELNLRLLRVASLIRQQTSGQKLSKTALTRRIESARPVLREKLRKEIVLKSYFTYRNMTEQELARYLEFYESPLGQQEIELTRRYVIIVIGGWMSDLFSDIAAQMEKEQVIEAAPAIQG